MKQQLKVGDKVTFDNDNINVFIEETTNVSAEITKYQKLVLAGINQIGTIKEYGLDMSTVSFNDGWDLPIPNKYLVVLPDVN
jgi:hypothetical protein